MENVIVIVIYIYSNSNLLHCLQHVIAIVIERKLSDSNLLHCSVIDPRPEIPATLDMSQG